MSPMRDLYFFSLNPPPSIDPALSCQAKYEIMGTSDCVCMSMCLMKRQIWSHSHAMSCRAVAVATG